MYSFLKTIANNLGVGVSNKAFARPAPVAVDSIYGPAYNIQGQYMSTMGGAVMINQTVVLVPITGNGAGLSNSAQLIPLAQVENA